MSREKNEKTVESNIIARLFTRIFD